LVVIIINIHHSKFLRKDEKLIFSKTYIDQPCKKNRKIQMPPDDGREQNQYDDEPENLRQYQQGYERQYQVDGHGYS